MIGGIPKQISIVLVPDIDSLIVRTTDTAFGTWFLWVFGFGFGAWFFWVFRFELWAWTQIQITKTERKRNY